VNRIVQTMAGTFVVTGLTLNMPPAQADAAQSTRGQALCEAHCASCHHATLRGSAHGSELTGSGSSAKRVEL
jgi:mono/diheme cytochrome c family protein